MKKETAGMYLTDGKNEIFSFKKKDVVEFKKNNTYSEKIEYISFKNVDSKVAEINKGIAR